MKKIYFLLMILTSCYSGKLSIDKQERNLVYVKPVIIRSDEGEQPAKSTIPEKQIERVYQKAKIDFIFLNPVFWDNTKARDGIYNLDQISQLATEQKIIKARDTLYMFFVNAIDRRNGPMGMGMQNGNLIFIALGDSLPDGFHDTLEDMQTFVIAHEIGHNFNLKHAVDDPNVPDNIPNIQGDGPFKDRINPKYSLNQYQIQIILKSPLIHKK